MKNFYLKHRYWLLPILFSLGILLVFLPIFFFTPAGDLLSDTEKIRNYVLSFEGWALVIYVLLSILVIVAPPIPNDLVPIAGGMIFGFWKALLFGLIARIIGSTINYWIGTRIRAGMFKKFISEEDQNKINKYTNKLGWQTIFVSRFLPSTDTDLIAYLAGMVKMNYRVFILASLAGMIPVVAISIFIGASLVTNKNLFYGLVVFYVVGMLFAPKIIKKFIRE